MPRRACLFSRCQCGERERLFYIGNNWRSFLFFSLGICHGFCYCLFESTWSEPRGGVFLLLISEMVQALAHVVLEEKKKILPQQGWGRFQIPVGFYSIWQSCPALPRGKQVFSIPSSSHHSHSLHKFKIIEVGVLNSDREKKSPVC